MSNQVKQLELDFGMLTVNQQIRVDSFKREQEGNVVRRTREIKKTQELLLSGGFQEGIDFVNDFKCETVTKTISLGYGDGRFEVEVTSIQALGGCSLITDYFNLSKNEMTISKNNVISEGDKLECTTITSQYRAYKPSSLLTKLKLYNEGQKSEFEKTNKTKVILDYTVEKYKKLFPNAEVTAGTDYNRINNYKSFPIVKIEFESKSSISFRLGWEKDNEYIHKKFDAVVNNMGAIEMLNMFNIQ
jgi:hypothetical protein|tara:strand:- start:352 stop:1086 length:735 start_codon:yes stop_codon:yes gene_type:complete